MVAGTAFQGLVTQHDTKQGGARGKWYVVSSKWSSGVWSRGLPKDAMPTIEVARRLDAYEELAAVRVGPAVCHR